MLEKLLDTLSHGGTLRTADLARQLDVSQVQVEMMIEHLARRGLLQAVEGCSDSQCANCSIAGACSAPTVQLWRRAN